MTRRKISPVEIKRFRKAILDYYQSHGRRLPWRNTRNPYHILVSEIMLQQTQVGRVIEKYGQFLSAFPDFASLALAPLRDLLSVWQGMGYNRRAIALKHIAAEVTTYYSSILPSSEELLLNLPGIGKATASSIAAFAFNKPSVFIETNIRRVFIHFFFDDRENIRDADILPLVAKTLDTTNPREWYYALMDYGSQLKTTTQNPNRRSAHYTRQSSFEGSRRQLRGKVLKEILATPSITESLLAKHAGQDAEAIREVLDQLQKEGFIKKKGKRFFVS
jgi:A/G-specific adenine glycosylase